MRIIAGRFKNRTICSTKADWLRPTSDRNREAIFSLIGNRLEGKRTLDLFAGTGALGIEALSRGAREATFVDRSHLAIGLIKRNLQQIGIEARCYKSTVLYFLKKATECRQQYDIIFCDPPYESTDITQILIQIAEKEILHPGGLLVLEMSARRDTIRIEQLKIWKQKILGDTCITIYERVGHGS